MIKLSNSETVRVERWLSLLPGSRKNKCVGRWLIPYNCLAFNRTPILCSKVFPRMTKNIYRRKEKGIRSCPCQIYSDGYVARKAKKVLKENKEYWMKGASGK